MATCILTCPACGWKESLLSSKPADPPPCPRCPGVVRMKMEDPPQDGQKTTWSTGGVR